MSHALELRLTHRYVGEYQHLDDWSELGRFDVLAHSIVITDDEDICEPQRETLLVCVETYQPEPKDRIELALAQSNTAWDCGHEYDCCGCRSYSAQAKHLGHNRYEVTIDSSRNY